MHGLPNLILRLPCIVDFDTLPYPTDILYAATDGPKVKTWYEAELNRFDSCINEKKVRQKVHVSTVLVRTFL